MRAFMLDSGADGYSLLAGAENMLINPRKWVGLIAVAAVLTMYCSPARRYRNQLVPPPTGSFPPPSIEATHLIRLDPERLQLTRDYFLRHNPNIGRKIDPGLGPESVNMVPQVIVVHYTAIPSLAETLKYFSPNRIASDRGQVTRNGELNVGVQFIVDPGGTIHRFYPETAMSRHVIGLNHVAIGIENVGEGDITRAQLRGSDAKHDRLTLAQLEANVSLIRYLQDKYPSIRFLIAHSEYRDLEDPDHPGHALFFEALPEYRTDKVDPGKRFMRELRRRLGM